MALASRARRRASQARALRLRLGKAICAAWPHRPLRRSAPPAVERSATKVEIGEALRRRVGAPMVQIPLETGRRLQPRRPQAVRRNAASGRRSTRRRAAAKLRTGTQAKHRLPPARKAAISTAEAKPARPTEARATGIAPRRVRPHPADPLPARTNGAVLRGRR